MQLASGDEIPGRVIFVIVALGLDMKVDRIRDPLSGQMPAADRRIGREPVWRPATIRKWQSQRPRGVHSDAEPTA